MKLLLLMLVLALGIVIGRYIAFTPRGPEWDYGRTGASIQGTAQPMNEHGSLESPERIHSRLSKLTEDPVLMVAQSDRLVRVADFERSLSPTERAMMVNDDIEAYYDYRQNQLATVEYCKSSLAFALMLKCCADPQLVLDRMVAPLVANWTNRSAADKESALAVLTPYMENVRDLARATSARWRVDARSRTAAEKRDEAARTLLYYKELDSLLPRYACDHDLIAVLGSPCSGKVYLTPLVHGGPVSASETK